MRYYYITQPTEEILSLESAKAYLRIDGTSEDVLIGDIIKSKRDEIEGFLSRTLLARDVLVAIAKPSRVIQVPVLPVMAVKLIQYYKDVDGTDVLTTLSADSYKFQKHQGCIIINDLSVLDDRSDDTEIEIIVTAGYEGIDFVPAVFIDAMRLMVREGYDVRCNRDVDPKYTTAAMRLLEPYRNKRIL